MEVLIDPRSAARLAAACTVLASLAPVTAAASTAPPTALPTVSARHALAADGLCDGHRWSLFGCRPDHHRIEQPEAGGLPSAG